MILLAQPETDTMNEFNDANWFSLEQSAKEGNVIPIVGPDALMVEYAGQTVPFYRLVAGDLLKSFQIDPESNPDILQHTWSLHKAVSAILASKGGPGIEQKIRREIMRLVDKYSRETQPAESLQLLASMPTFTLYVSLTPDNLLERAMMASDPSSAIPTITFWPRDASESLADLSLPRPGERSIFQMLGSCTSAGSGFAMHEEEALESLYWLQTKAARRFAVILAELRRRDKLFINCNFPDWLGRATLRLVNDNRFSAKDTQEFICPSTSDAGLSAFLTQYSPNTLGFEGNVDDLIQQLARSLETVPLPLKFPIASRKVTNGRCPTVFVSYASENAAAARSIADTLLELGFSDVWLDKKKLIGGDNWSDRIDEAIEKCDFFIPLLSREADSRREGVFWGEWKTASERARRIKGAYLLPVGIDPEFPVKDHYQRISDGDTAVFFSKHLFHAPNGNLKAEDCAAFSERCRHFEEESHD